MVHESQVETGLLAWSVAVGLWVGLEAWQLWKSISAWEIGVPSPEARHGTFVAAQAYDLCVAVAVATVVIVVEIVQMLLELVLLLFTQCHYSI